MSTTIISLQPPSSRERRTNIPKAADGFLRDFILVYAQVTGQRAKLCTEWVFLLTKQFPPTQRRENAVLSPCFITRQPKLQLGYQAMYHLCNFHMKFPNVYMLMFPVIRNFLRTSCASQIFPSFVPFNVLLLLLYHVSNSVVCFCLLLNQGHLRVLFCDREPISKSNIKDEPKKSLVFLNQLNHFP